MIKADRLCIRWMSRRKDFGTVLRIEESSFDDPLSIDELLQILDAPQAVTLVAELHNEVVAYMTYRLDRKVVYVDVVAVDEAYRRRGIGTAMFEKLKNKVGLNLRKAIVIYVRERNLPMQLFLRDQGFRCHQIVNNYFDGDDEPAYRFCYRVEDAT